LRCFASESSQRVSRTNLGGPDDRDGSIENRAINADTSQLIPVLKDDHAITVEGLIDELLH
jgi:hypothetical protein